jgi:pilus assembly protein CpaE
MNANDHAPARAVVVASPERAPGIAAWAAGVEGIEVVATAEAREALRVADAKGAKLLLADRDADDTVIGLLERARSVSGVGVVVVTASSDTAFDRRALRAGALEVLGEPLDGAANAAMAEALAELRRRRVAGTAEPPRRREATPVAPVIAVVSAKGGVGRSFVAVNIASVLVKTGKVVLCDLDLQFSDVSHWGVETEPERTIDQLGAVVVAGEVQLADVQTIAASRFGGVTLLPGARSPLDGAAWASERGVRSLRLVGALRRWFDWVVVDDLPGLLEPVVGIARGASLLLVVTTAEVGSVRATKRYLELLDRYAPTPRFIVVNRSNAGLSGTLVRAALGASERMVFVKEDRTFARRLVVEGLAASEQRGRGVSRTFAKVAAQIQASLKARA